MIILNNSFRVLILNIAKLKEQNRLIRVGTLKSGYWEVKVHE
ncbi:MULTISPECIES: hypothetical protein [Arcobacteraceae]|nr:MULTISPECIES: hypothetical protein [Arcobacteraceae]